MDVGKLSGGNCAHVIYLPCQLIHASTLQYINRGLLGFILSNKLIKRVNEKNFWHPYRLYYAVLRVFSYGSIRYMAVHNDGRNICTFKCRRYGTGTCIKYPYNRMCTV